MDYFFSPAGWARTRWTDNFFKETIPRLAEDELIRKGGLFWLPNLECVAEAIQLFRGAIERHYSIEYVKQEQLMENPLYEATERVREQLAACPDQLTNETQMRPLLEYSRTPFLLLRRRDVPLPWAADGAAGAATGTSPLGGSSRRRARPAPAVTPPSSQGAGGGGDAGTVNWVQCNACSKWRIAPAGVDVAALPEVWQCSEATWTNGPSPIDCDTAEDVYVPPPPLPPLPPVVAVDSRKRAKSGTKSAAAAKRRRDAAPVDQDSTVASEATEAEAAAAGDAGGAQSMDEETKS